MNDLNVLIDHINQKVSGVVTVKLFKGTAEVVAVETANTIFDEKLATFMKSSAFNQNASPGFIEIYTMQMRLAQHKERYALLTIGEEANKKKFLPLIKELQELGFKFYATERTHLFYKKKGIDSILVHKMYKKEFPNLEDVLRQNVVDLIINTSYSNQFPEAKKDESIIRKWAVENDIPLVREFNTAKELVTKLKKRIVTRKKK